MEQVLLISFLSGLATGVGGLIVVWFGQPTAKVLGFYLGLSAGMMGMVVLVDLLPAALQYGTVKQTLIGLIIGIALMLIFDLALASFLATGKSRKVNPAIQPKFKRNFLRMGYFMTFAIALHNIPEGLAIGAGFASQSELGIRVALVIALHNIPEGLGVASTLFLGKIKKVFVVLLPIATGFFIPLGTMLANLLGSIVADWITFGLSIAGGAMGYLVIKDIGPESLKQSPIIGRTGIGVGIFIMYLVYHLHS